MRARIHAIGSLRSAAVVASAIVMGLAGGSVAAYGALGPVGTSRPLAVSVPSDPVPLGPGGTRTIPVRIVNPGSRPVTVRVGGQRVNFGDDGRVTIAGPDPSWDGRVDFPTHPITIAAKSFHNVGLTVHMPARISPDFYFIGFLVTPVPEAAADLTYINRIGSYLTINVPGARTRRLAAALELPAFAISGRAHARLHVRNVGKATAIYWGENDTSATPGSSTPLQQRIEGSMLPIGRSRTIAVEATPSFPIAVVTIRVRIFYPGRTDATTRQLLLTKHILVVQPVALVVLAVGGLGGLIWFGRRRRRRRRSVRRRATTARPRSPRKGRARSAQPRVPTHAARARVDRELERVRAEHSRRSEIW